MNNERLQEIFENVEKHLFYKKAFLYGIAFAEWTGSEGWIFVKDEKVWKTSEGGEWFTKTTWELFNTYLNQKNNYDK